MNVASHIPSPQDEGRPPASSTPPVVGGAPVGEDEVDLFDYIEVLVKRRWLIFWGVAICILAAFVVSLRATPTYTATATLLPSEENIPDLNLSNTPQGVSRSSRISYLGVLGSVSLNKAVLEKEYRYHRGEKDSVSQTLINYFNTQMPSQAIDALLGMAKFEEGKSGILKIDVTTPYPELSAQVANEYVNQLMIYNEKRLPTRIHERLRFTEQRLEEVRGELSKAEEALLNFQKSNVNFIGGPGGTPPDLSLELSRLQREVNVKSGLFTTLVNQYEVARIEARGQTPVIEVLNYADPKDCVSSLKSRNQSVLISAAVGLMVTVFLAFFLEYIEKNRQTGRIDRLKEILQEDRSRFRRIFGRSQR